MALIHDHVCHHTHTQLPVMSSQTFTPLHRLTGTQWNGQEMELSRSKVEDTPLVPRNHYSTLSLQSYVDVSTYTSLSYWNEVSSLFLSNPNNAHSLSWPLSAKIPEELMTPWWPLYDFEGWDEETVTWVVGPTVPWFERQLFVKASSLFAIYKYR